MKGTLVIVFILIFVDLGFGQEKWKKDGIKLPPPICYASDEVHQFFVGPPAEYFERLKAGSVTNTKIIVDYVDFPSQAQQAFQYAVDIWQTLVSSSVPIHVQAKWKSLDKSVLGSCGPGDFYKNFNSTQIWDCYYPVALVEKMLGEEVNSPGSYDIVGSFNKDFPNWYFGLDGETPGDKYDFVSTVLHELTHGLGFSGFFYSDLGSGGYGDDGLPAVFDEFVKNKSGQLLVDKSIFSNPSKTLNTNLTSGWLEFYTTLLEGSLPRLYAPATWDDGSSIYHLDETIYPFIDTNALMTPFSAKGEAHHTPGPNTLSIMYEMGWKGLSIKHKQLRDIEFAADSILFEAQIESDYGLDSSKLVLVYFTANSIKPNYVPLKAANVSSVFRAKLSPQFVGKINYYFSATDKINRQYVFPSNAPTRLMSFTIGPDNQAPVITHDPIKYMLTANPSATIKSEVTDNIGVKSVSLEYFVNGGPLKSVELVNNSNDSYSGTLTFLTGSVKDGDVVSYRIIAYDKAQQSNLGRLPVSGYYTFKIEGSLIPVDKYVNNFNSTTSDFIGSDFVIKTVSGFDSPALNSPHPYPSPDSDNQNYNFKAILKYPIFLTAGAKMSFDEIVLVEPGEVGVPFGNENFWDYVIVEGSKDGGITWKPFINGYDSNAQLSWSILYNKSISGNNSTSIPTKDLFVKRDIDLLANGNFAAGDVVMVQFRLFSDPYAHGWGWIIDNLNIQDIGTAIDARLLSAGEVNLFPNPVKNLLNLQINAKSNIHKLFMRAYGSDGNLVYNQSFAVEGNVFQTTIDVSKLKPGLFLFALEPENSPVITRKIVVQ